MLIQSPQDFVRALKSATDPPSDGGPSKFQIARRAWDDVSFYVPNKAELIADWILTKLLKEKGYDTERNPILDIRFWGLLEDVIRPNGYTSAPRPSKTWLGAILIRVPIVPIVSSFLSLYARCNTRQDTLTAVFANSLLTLWPLGVQKTTAEILLECFGIALPLLQNYNADTNMSNVMHLITNSYQSSLANNSNKRKLFNLFLQHHFHQWLECMTTTPDDPTHAQLIDVAYNAGVNTLFGPDVLRQSVDGKAENPVLNSFRDASKSSRNNILSVLPRLFSSFLQSIKKYRANLFGQGSAASTAKEIDAIGMQFFIACQPLFSSSVEEWGARNALLDIVRAKNLFTISLSDAATCLEQICELAITSLSESENAELALDCLSILTQIDYDIVLPALPRLLPQLLLIRHGGPFVTFLDLLLDYYTKTRTIPNHISNLLNIALSPKHITPVGYDDPCEIYRLRSACVLLHPIHLDHLAKRVQSFVTSSQTLQLAKTIVEILETAWADLESTARLIRKANTVEVSPQILSVRFSLLATFASVVLVSLPVRSLPSEERTSLNFTLDPLRCGFVPQVVRKLSKTIRDRPCQEAWEWQICAAAALRIGYVLDVSRNLALPHSDYDPKFTKRVMELAGNGDLLPELSLETFRYLLNKGALRDRSETEALFDNVLAYIEQRLSSTRSKWSGHAYQLTYDEEGNAKGALAVLHVLAERWLPVFDAYATAEQLKRFIALVLGDGLDDAPSPDRTELRPQDVPLMVLRSAQFWELPNIRPVFLSTLLDSTTNLHEPSDNKIAIRAASLYRFLLYIPMEYLSKPSRTELVKRALSADIYLCAQTTEAGIGHLLTVLRVFLKRVFTHTGFIEPSVLGLVGFLEHLVNNKLAEADATLDLMKLYFQELLRNAERGSKDIVRVFHSMKTWVASETDTWQGKAVVRMIEFVTTEFSINGFPEDIKENMKTTYKQLIADTLPKMASNMDKPIAPGKSKDIITLWTCLLSFGHWLGQEDRIQLFGLRLASGIIAKFRKEGQATTTDEMRVTALTMMIQELQCIPESEQTNQLKRIIAVYGSFASSLDDKGRERLDSHMSRAFKIVSVSSYAHTLTLVSEMLANPSSDKIVSIVRLAIRLLKDNPQSTFKHARAFATQCINAFTSHDDIFVHGSLELRIKVLDHVVQLCSERPAALRSNDVSGIWDLLYKFLAPFHAHDEETSTVIYHRIISATGALVRLRRDLVTWTLPHLVQMLRQLTLCLRACRPMLGAKQTGMVMGTQPRWISTKQGLGAEEAKALSRLMETLNTKTVVRIHAQGETKKAESLSRPFSKHAIYVVKAYVECVNDPLCVMSAEVRRELEPGLFALCGMASDHSRDAVMASGLDAGGKSVMKALWREYEKQKYVGQG